MRGTWRRGTWSLKRPRLWASCFCIVVGCQSARVPAPLPATLFGNEPDAQMEFWHTLASRKLTSNDEAFHGLLLYLDGRDEAGAYADRVKLLKSRRMLGP